MPHDDKELHPIRSTVGAPGDERAGREHLSTGALLTKLGNRVGQPVRHVGPPRRRPLLPAQATSPALEAGGAGQDACVAAVVTLLKQIAAWDKNAVERARAVARYAV